MLVPIKEQCTRLHKKEEHLRFTQDNKWAKIQLEN